MTEYIDRQALEVALNHRLSYLIEEYSVFDHYTTGYSDAVFAVENFPSADAVPVVRCKGCKYKVRTDANGIVICSEEHGMYCPTENDFCSYGERRDGVDNKEQRRWPDGNNSGD